jgi:hypothetical protein
MYVDLVLCFTRMLALRILLGEIIHPRRHPPNTTEQHGERDIVFFCSTLISFLLVRLEMELRYGLGHSAFTPGVRCP